MSELDEAIRQYKVIEAKLVELENLWNILQKNMPNGIPLRANPDYEDACRAYEQLLTELPLIDTWKPITLPCTLDEIAQSCFDVLEVRKLQIPIQICRQIEEPGKELREYRFRFNQKRKQFIEDVILKTFTEIDKLLEQLREKFPIHEESIDAGKTIKDSAWQILNEKVNQIDVLLGSSVQRIPRWGDLRRHLYYQQINDLRDIINSDWPSVKGGLIALLGITNLEVNDLAEFDLSKKARIDQLSKLLDTLPQEYIETAINESRLQQFLEISQKAGINVLARLIDWITTTAKVGDVVNVLEKLEVDDLQKLNAAVGLSNLKSVLLIWQDNKKNDNEEFWQGVLAQNSLLEYRDRIFEATISASNALLTIENFDEAVNTALQIIGEKLDSDRVAVIQNLDSPANKFPQWKVVYEWHSPHTVPQISHPHLAQGSYEGVQEWYVVFSQGEGVSFLLEEMPEPFRSGQAELGVKALHVVPIFVKSEFWGVIGFDDCREAKRRSLAELAVLKTAAACIGSAIESDRTRQALRE